MPCASRNAWDNFGVEHTDLIKPGRLLLRNWLVALTKSTKTTICLHGFAKPAHDSYDHLFDQVPLVYFSTALETQGLLEEMSLSSPALHAGLIMVLL